MICYYDLSIPLRSLMILALFLVFCCGGWLLHASSQRKTRAAAPVALLGMLLSGSLMILYTAEARANLRGLAVPAVSDRFCSAPLIVPFLVFLAVLTAFFRL
ncbi:MAG: hypothetical protein IIY16_04695, partial [Oscillospiraceae bacterium]|nr:hypothetical protein [Oscillospiraceae bacterium]